MGSQESDTTPHMATLCLTFRNSFFIVFHKSNQPHNSDINSAESWCIILTLPDSYCGDFVEDLFTKDISQ